MVEANSRSLRGSGTLVRALLVLACAAHYAGGAEAKASRHRVKTTCTALGYSGLQLCSDCALMAQFVKNRGTKDSSAREGAPTQPAADANTICYD